MMDAHEIAAKAAELVGGDRGATHGRKGDNLRRSAMLWTAYMAIRRDRAAALSPADFANMMVLAKMSRTQSGALFNMDDYVDMAGYAALGGEIAAIDTERAMETKIDDAFAEFDAALASEAGLDDGGRETPRWPWPRPDGAGGDMGGTET